MKKSKIAVIGAGAWGSALAIAASRTGVNVISYDINTQVVDAINTTHTNPTYLPGITFPTNISATTDLKEAVQVEAMILVVPAQIMAKACQSLQQAGLAKNIPLIICAKGIEQKTLRLMSQVIGEYFPANPLAVLSGPNFAIEVAKGFPAAATLACEDEQIGHFLMQLLGRPDFRLYYSSDVIGAQVAGAIKNVLAIACGVALGKGFGENTKATVMTRGMAEIKHLCIAMGGQAETLLGLCGMGDLSLTCNSLQSRNMSFGFALGQGISKEDYFKKHATTVEGAATAATIHAIAQKYQIEMPICEAVYKVLYENVSVDQAIRNLLQLPLSIEA